MDRISVISRGNRWSVVKYGAKRAIRLFDYREEAYFAARQISNTVCVHKRNGQVKFVYDNGEITTY